jgi:hypothetical protein
MIKRTLLTTAIALIAGSEGSAQLPSFLTMDTVNINKINALVLVHGDMWWNPATGDPHCYFPAASGKSISFVGALWMSGYDAANNLHVAAQTYRQDGNDYWPGPLDAGNTLSYATSQDWARIWKVNRSDIQAFQSLPSHDTLNTPQAILTWPAVGNTYARGNNGAPLTMVPGNTYAPFIDLNGDGIYQPLLGDYPNIKGDQALWYIFSDHGPEHTATNATPLGVEIQAMAYAYNRGTLVDNIIYYEYSIINRSPNTYHDFRIGQYADMDLGYYLDDYIGFDSSHRMGIIYNGLADDGGLAGHPSTAYGTTMPMAGITLISLPGDAGTTHVPAGSFIYYNNDASVIGNPSSGVQYDNYLRSANKAGQHFTNDFIGPGIPSKGYGSGPNCNYVFSGDPYFAGDWSECSSGNQTGDRRFVITSNDFTLNPGEKQTVVMALVATDPATNNGCPGLSFASIKSVADTAWNVFYNPLPPIGVGVQALAGRDAIEIYPNPAHSMMHIKNERSLGEQDIKVFNTMGQVVNAPFSETDHSLDISNLPAGLYLLRCQTGETFFSKRFTKE